MITAQLLVQVGGLTAFALTLLWLYSRELREKYAMGWILTACGLLVLGIFPRLIMVFADASRLAYPSAVLFVAIAAIYLFSMGITVTLTWQRRATLRLAQEIALLRMRIVALEAHASTSTDAGEDAATGCGRSSHSETGAENGYAPSAASPASTVPALSGLVSEAERAWRIQDGNVE